MVEPPTAEGGGDQKHRYSMREASRLKGVAYRTVSRAERLRQLPAQRIGRMAFIAAADLQAWRPMVQRTPRKYRRQAPDPTAAPTVIDFATAERVELAHVVSSLLNGIASLQTDRALPLNLTILCNQFADALDLRRVEVWMLDDAYVRATRAASFGPALSELPDEIALSEIPGGAGGGETW